MTAFFVSGCRRVSRQPRFQAAFYTANACHKTQTHFQAAFASSTKAA
ncbi:hypothetical protein [Kingella oralis]